MNQCLWAPKNFPDWQTAWLSWWLQRYPHCSHWSRRFEYPWVLNNGDFQQGQWVLDAGGGDTPLGWVISKKGCQVVNVDLEASKTTIKNIQSVQGDLRKLDYPDNLFHRVICVSVLEHIPEPMEAVHELWRVLQVGGRLVLTFDVADYPRWNHSIDCSIAYKIAKVLKTEIPHWDDGLIQIFPEYEPAADEPKEVTLKVLCMAVDKE